MNVASALECPRCGAPLPKGSGGTIVCKYCRVTVNLPERPQPVRRHPVRHSASLAWLKPWFKAEMVFALVIGLGMAGWQLQRLSSSPSLPPDFHEPPPTGTLAPPDPPPQHPIASDPRPRHVEGKLLVVPAKEDAPLVVATATFDDHGDKRWLAAWRADSGRLRWRWPLPAGNTPANTERAAHTDSIVLRSAEVVTRLDAESGRALWTSAAPASHGRLCASHTYVGVTAGKPPRRALDWQTGKPLDVVANACETLYSSEDAGPNFQYLAASTLTTLPKRPKDFTVVRGLLPKQGNARVVLGTVGPAATPAVSVVASGRWVWQQNVSAYTAAQLPEPPVAAVRRESVVVPFWDTQNHRLRVAAFSLANGARLWEAALTEETSVRTNVELDVGVTLDGMLVVLVDGRLQAYALSTGELRWSTGE